MSDAVVIISGGLDSTVLAYYIKRNYDNMHLVSFNYGQRHVKELHYAMRTAHKLNAKHTIIDLTNLTPLISQSSLTNPDIVVPDGHYAEETMRITVVPNRNAIMLAIAYGIAVNEKAHIVAAGVHTGDHFIYPDCRPPFFEYLNKAFQHGNEGFGLPHLRIVTPFIGDNKSAIAREGARLNVPMFTDTWSCYKGGEIHCGTCGTCVERREAFQLAQLEDTTLYLSSLEELRGKQ